MDARTLAYGVKSYMLDMRREFHRHPEPSLKEFETSRRIQEELTQMGIPYVCVGNTTGILATIVGGKPGKTILLRCDMDALEIQEESGVEFASETPGVMHACGHDGHMAMVLATGRALMSVQEELAGTVKLLFQPAEEVGMGGMMMIENGVMDGVDGCFGEHLWSGIPVGKISVEAGPRMASCGFFKIHVKGKSGHGARPQEGVDAAVASSAIVLNLQSIVSRETSPLDSAVVTIGRMDVGVQSNIIAEEATLHGTTRTYTPAIREKFEDMILRIARSTAQAYRAQVKLEYRDIVAPVINDEACSAMAARAVSKILGEDAVTLYERLTVAEDMSAYMNKAPGMMAFVGVGNPQIGADVEHHNCRFKMDEEGIFNGLMLYLQYTLDWLEANAQ